MDRLNLDESPTPLWIGYVAVVIAVLFFGSNLVPAARYPIGDGFSFQFFMCCGIWFTGLIIDLFVKTPPFYPLVLLSGVLWTTGNILCLLVIPINGLGMSMLLWCTTNMLIGWASGHFGWFGLIPEDVENRSLNYLGVIIGCLSGLVFLGIRTTQHETNVHDHEENDEQQPILQPTISPANRKFAKRTIGSIVAIVAGLLFGLIFVPVTFIQDHPTGIYENASKNGLDYVYAMYSGIFFSSMCFYLIYIAFRTNRPYLHVESILPGIVSGIMWGIAQAAFLVANSVLSQAISFPLVTIGPGTVAVLWSIFYFKDIRGKRNFFLILFGSFLRVFAALLVVLSKPIRK